MVPQNEDPIDTHFLEKFKRQLQRNQLVFTEKVEGKTTIIEVKGKQVATTTGSSKDPSNPAIKNAKH